MVDFPIDVIASSKENVSNKSTNVNTDQASNTKYPSVKAVFDWATNLFFPKPTGTTAQYLRGDGSLETFPTIPDVSGLVAKADYTPAHSILAQQSGTGSPTAVQIGNNEFLGRKSGGGSNIEGLSVSETKGILNYTASDVGAVATNSAITGATKTKITYDAKGLVTAGADATTADIPDSTDKRYVTDTQQSKIDAIGVWNDITADCTIVGWSSYTFHKVFRLIENNNVTYKIIIRGTSNSTTTTVTIPDTNIVGENLVFTSSVVNNGALSAGSHVFNNATQTISFTQNLAGSPFTGIGSKSIWLDFSMPISL